MKKIILLISALLLLVSATCFAAGNGAQLTKEEKTCDKMFEAFAGKGNYEEIAPLITNELAKNMPEAKFLGLGKEMQDKLGGIKAQRFVMLQKFDKADRVVYLAETGRKTVAEIAFVFVSGEKPLLFEFTIRELKPQQQQQPQSQPAPQPEAEE